MSQVDDDFDDDWDDFTPSFQDKLIEKLEYAENNANALSDAGTESDFDDSMKADFDVFLDELFEIPFKVKGKAAEAKSLSEIPTNMQNVRTPLRDIDKNIRKERYPEEGKRIMDSQDDSFWTELDTDLLSKLESNAQKENRSTAMESNTNKKESGATPTFVGFKTASGKTLKPPSKEAIQKASKLCLDEEAPKEPRATSFTSGFTTGNGRKLEVSENARLKAMSILQEADDKVKDEKPPPRVDTKDTSKIPMTVGFTTASGRAVAISEKARQRAMTMFKELEEDRGSPNTTKDNTSEDSSQRASIKRPPDEPLSTDAKYENVLGRYGGFKMGHNQKGIPISANTKRQAISLIVGDSAVPSPSSKTNENTELHSSKTSNYPIVPDISPDKDTPTITKSSTTRNKRVAVAQKQNKPFKSPIVRSNIELTRAAIQNNTKNKPKAKPVFDLTIPQNRYSLSSLGKPLQFSKERLLSRNIPMSIISMTVSSAKSYLFDGYWGYREARKDLLKAGAVSTRLPMDWVENHYGLIVWKFACLIRSYPSEYFNYWSPDVVLNQLLYRYEREMNMGHRPILRKIMEQDDLSVKHMVLAISEIIKIKNSLFYNTSSKYQLILTDGWYQVPACIDFRMERAIEKRKLKVGHKLSICGAQIVGDQTAQSPLKITNNSTMLSISTNGCLPAKWDTKLGYQKHKLIMRSISTIFDDGGLITALDIVVCRKFPMLYSETLPNGIVITRTAKEEEEARHIPDHLHGLQRQQSAFALPNFKAEQKLNNLPHLDRTCSEPKKMEFRRVTGFFKIRICDAKSNSDQPLATLLISNANELNHMDIVEGNRYKVLFVVPYRPKNRKYPGLDLKTTRMTRWEPTPSANLKNAYIPRFLTPCRDIHRQDASSEFDIAVFVIQVGTATLHTLNGRKLYHQKLFVSDESGQICQIDFRIPLAPFPDIKGQVIGLVNIRFELYDNKFDITCLKSTDETEVVTKLSSASEYIQKGVLKLRKWVSDHPKRMQELIEHVQSIVQ